MLKNDQRLYDFILIVLILPIFISIGMALLLEFIGFIGRKMK